MKKAGLYIRVSTLEQASEGYSIEAQRDKLISYTKLMGWTIQDTYIDGGFSGTNMNRPELQRLLENLESIDIVLVYKLDRLSRSQRDILWLVEEKFMTHNAGFVSIIESFDTSTPFGKAMIGILAVFAQLERETIIERTKLGKERRAKEGYWNGGPSPIGYDLINGKLVVNEYEAMQIKKIFELYKSYGQNKTAEKLNAMGYKTKYGDWKGRSIARIVSNPIYMGMVHYKDAVYKGIHDPIITKKNFDEIQRVIGSRLKHSPSRSKYLLGGLVWCGYCDARLKASFSNSGKGKNRFYYYVCYSVSKRPVHMVKDENCPGHYWKMKDLENIIIKEIKNIKLDKNKFIEHYTIYYDKKKNTPNKLKVLEDRIADIRCQTKKLMDLYQFNNIPIQSISERIEKLHQEKNSIEINISEYKKINLNEPKVPLDSLLDIFQDFDLIWDEAIMSEKKQILNILIKKIIVTDFVRIEWNL